MPLNPTWALVLAGAALALLLLGFNRSGLISAVYGRQKAWRIGFQLFAASTACSGLLLAPAVWLSGRADVFWAEAAALAGLLFLYWRLPKFLPQFAAPAPDAAGKVGAALRFILECGWVVVAVLQVPPLLAGWSVPWQSWGLVAIAGLAFMFAASGAANLGRLAAVAFSGVILASLLVFLTAFTRQTGQPFVPAWLLAPPWSISMPALAVLAFVRESSSLYQQRWLLCLPDLAASRRAVLIALGLKFAFLFLLLLSLSGGGTLSLQPRPGVAALVALAATHSSLAATAVSAALVVLLLAGAAALAAPLYTLALTQIAPAGYASWGRRVAALLGTAAIVAMLAYGFDWIREAWSELLELAYGVIFASLVVGARLRALPAIAATLVAVGLVYGWREWTAAPVAPSLALAGMLCALPALLLSRKRA